VSEFTEFWKTLGVVTTARVKRMADTQFISELMLVILERSILGFDQDQLDALYAKYDDDPEESEVDFSEEDFTKKMAGIRSYVLKLEEKNAVSLYAGSFVHFYTLWCVLALNLASVKAMSPAEVSSRYDSFMGKVEKLAAEKDLEKFIKADSKNAYKAALTYYSNARGASTDLKPRQERYNVLKRQLLG
jgi:hypothetical protein